MSAVYTRANFYSDLARDASGVTNIDRLVNRAARFVVSDIDLRSTKRMSYLSPNLNENQYDYVAPTDLKELAIVDVRQIEGREESNKFNLTTTEYFDRNKADNENLICIEDRSFLKKLRISANLDEDTGNEVEIHECDSLTADGTWSVSGNASNLTLDSDMYVHGDGSLNFDMATAWTAASTVVVGMEAVDLSDFETGGSVFVLAYISSTTGLTSINIKVGSDSSNYFRQSKTTTNESLSFHTGWNLLRMDFASATETGTVDMDNVDYLEVGFVGDGTASAITYDWRLDYFVARRGKPHEVWYYTKFPWQTSVAVYLENSTASTDLLNADTEEYELFILKGKQILALDSKEFDDAKEYQRLYEEAKSVYLSHYPTERLLMIQTYYKYHKNINEAFLDN